MDVSFEMLEKNNHDSNRTGVTAKKKKWLTKFKWCYSSEFHCLTKSTKGPKICISDFSISQFYKRPLKKLKTP